MTSQHRVVIGIFVSQRDVFSFAFKDINTNEIIILKSIFKPIFFVLQYTITIHNTTSLIERIDCRRPIEWSNELCVRLFGFNINEDEDYDEFFDRQIADNGMRGTTLAQIWLRLDMIIILADVFNIHTLENEIEFICNLIDKNESICEIVTTHQHRDIPLSHDTIRFLGESKLSEAIYITEEIKFAMKITQSHMVDGSRLMRIEERPVDDIVFQELIDDGILTMDNGTDNGTGGGTDNGTMIGMTPTNGDGGLLTKYEPCDVYVQRNMKWTGGGGGTRMPAFEKLNEKLQFSHRMYLEYGAIHTSLKAILDKLPDVQRLLFICEERRNLFYEFVEYTSSHTLIDRNTGELCFYRDNCIWIPKQKKYHKGTAYEHYLPLQTCTLTDLPRIANQINDHLDMVILLTNQYGQPIPNRFVQWIDYLCGRKVKLCYCNKSSE